VKRSLAPIRSEQRDELAAFHSITSSAATSRPGGTVTAERFQLEEERSTPPGADARSDTQNCHPAKAWA